MPGEVGPQGPAGPQGPEGPAGPSGVADTVWTNASTTGSKTTGAQYPATASCTGGRTLIGGGARVVQGDNTGQPTLAVLTESYPSSTGANGAWTAKAMTTTTGNGGSNSPQVQAYAICAE